MVSQLFILLGALYLVIRGATLATRHAAHIAASFKLPQYTVGFIIIAIISILPEGFIALSSSIAGIPAFGFGTLLGSNVADLTIIVALTAFFARRALKVESKILKNHTLYPFILFIPIVLGFDGYLSRSEGVVLIIVGIIFYYLTLKHTEHDDEPHATAPRKTSDILYLLLSLALLLLGAHYTVSSASNIAYNLGIAPVIVGMLVVGLGTTMPEFFFSLKAVKANNDSLALGDILGTVLADATIVVGLLALLSPFSFPKETIYIAGVFMVISSLILFSFMRSGKLITQKEAYVLVLFWITFICVQSIIVL